MPRRRPSAQSARRRGVSAPEQESGQREEDGDGQVEPAEQASSQPAVLASLEGGVGDHHPDRGTGPHPFNGGQEAAGPTDLGFRVASLSLGSGGTPSIDHGASLPDDLV